jgi:hypothetical protein
MTHRQNRVLTVVALTLVLGCQSSETHTPLDRKDYSVKTHFFSRRFGRDLLTADLFLHRSLWFDSHRPILLATDYCSAEALQLRDSTICLKLFLVNGVSDCQYITHVQSEAPELEVGLTGKRYDAIRIFGDSTTCCVFGLFRRTNPPDAYLFRLGVNQVAMFDVHIFPCESVSVIATSTESLALAVRWPGRLGEDTLDVRVDRSNGIDLEMSARQQ